MALWDFVKDAGKSVFGSAEAAEAKTPEQADTDRKVKNVTAGDKSTKLAKHKPESQRCACFFKQRSQNALLARTECCGAGGRQHAMAPPATGASVCKGCTARLMHA